MTISENKLTVAIPTYNRKEYLNECLESLAMQTYKDFKVIIFDNNSDYDVSELISQFPKLDITIDKNEKNIGNRANFVKIISYNFQSPYVIMLHDDDALHPKYFEIAINFLNAHHQVVWVGSNINFVRNAKISKMLKFDSHISNGKFDILGQDELVKKIMRGFNLGFGTVIYRAKTLSEARISDDKFEKWCDRPLLIDLAQNQKIAVTPVKFMNYRMHEQKDSHIRKPSDLGYLINLFNYYKGISNERDTYRFKVLEADNSINTATHTTTTFKELADTLEKLREAGLFSFRYISPKGIYYFIKFAIRKLL